METIILKKAVSQSAGKTVTFSQSKPEVSLGKSKSGTQKSTSQQQLGKKTPSATGRRKPAKRSPIRNFFSEFGTRKYFASLMTLLLFSTAVVMIILYFYKQIKMMMGKSDAMTMIREFMISQNESFKGKSDSEILDEAQRLAENLLQLKSGSDQIEKATVDIIDKLIKGWMPFLGNLYYFSAGRTLRNFEMCREVCEGHKADLVDITSQAEEEFVEEEVIRKSGTFYIGLTRQQGMWQWVTGEPLTTSFWGPGGGNGGGSCAIMDRCGGARGKCWHDINCAMDRQFICKVKPNPKYL